MNEKFFALPEEKQERIINAAMEVFGKNEYKRASTDLIAVKAGISKGLLFYYFHNKISLSYRSSQFFQSYIFFCLYTYTGIYRSLYAFPNKVDCMREDTGYTVLALLAVKINFVIYTGVSKCM